MKKQLAVGIDIGGTNVVVGLANKEGTILKRNTFPMATFVTPESFVEKITASIRSEFAEFEANYDLKGIGIGAPNGNYYTGSIEFAPNLKWEGVVPLASMFREHFDVLVALTNDANAAALGEKQFGHAKGMNDFLVVTLGTGVGSGFVANGKLILGHDGFAGELGHAIVFMDGRQCACGRKGCLERYASAGGIVETMKEYIAQNPGKSILEERADFKAKDIYDAAIKGDQLALEAFDYTGKILGFMLSQAVAVTSPEAIFLFGGLAASGKLIFEPTKRYMEDYLLNVFRNKVQLLPSGLPESDVAVLGAAALAW